MRSKIHKEILPRVSKPSRYLGTEWNAVRKSWEETPVKMVFAFPDLYEIGMSHLGLQIIYGLINEEEDFLLERVFTPAEDMELQLRNYGIPLFSLESYRPIKDFDVVGFTLQYELGYSNILNMLDLAYIPLESSRRDASCPIIMAGGPCAFNPEPLADFIDLFVLGDGEEILPEILDMLKTYKNGRPRLRARRSFLHAASGIKGVYVPSLYRASYNGSGFFEGLAPVMKDIPEKITRRVVKDLDKAFFPHKPIVPYLDIVHDRIMVEVMRGCTRGCRFCQAGMVYRPVRERSPRLLEKQIKELVQKTGHGEVSLTSLSTTDYSNIKPLLHNLVSNYASDKISFSLPSLRIDTFAIELAKLVQHTRKTGLTFAPEAGTQRMRDVINKGVTKNDLLEATGAAFRAGWNMIKLYFMIGLPTERQEDLDGIIELAQEVLSQGRNLKGPKERGRVRINVSISSFVPKPHTPFQWEPQDSMEVLRRKQNYLRARLASPKINLSWHGVQMSFIEAVFARGDRRLAPVLYEAWKKGCKLDGWAEHFRYDLWQQSFRERGIDPAFYACRRLSYGEKLPWDHIETGVSRKFLINEHRKALQEAKTPDCRFGKCPGCGVCESMDIEKHFKRGRFGAEIEN